MKASEAKKFVGSAVSNKTLTTVSAYDYPIYGSQWHPEKNMFQWSTDHHLNHSYGAVRVAQYFANFFVNEGKSASGDVSLWFKKVRYKSFSETDPNHLAKKDSFLPLLHKKMFVRSDCAHVLLVFFQLAKTTIDSLTTPVFLRNCSTTSSECSWALPKWMQVTISTSLRMKMKCLIEPGNL